jgi:D-alanyl-D-alanine-carboxypeptidase/D-alanyl-D-alanine-endopeptidase
MEIVSGHFEPILGKVPAVVVAVLAGDEVEVHALGTLAGEPDPASLCWEVGSITKVFTGLLLAEMSISGEVRLDDPVGRYLPDPVARRLPALAQQPTLADLATHTAGLARLPWPIIRRGLRSSDPYAGLSESLVLGCLGPGTKRPRRDRIRYSNFGMGLLGHLLGLASGRPYETLVGERILSPLEMASTSVGGCGPGQGHCVRQPPTSSPSLAPASTLRTTRSVKRSSSRGGSATKGRFPGAPWAWGGCSCIRAAVTPRGTTAAPMDHLASSASTRPGGSR